MLGWIMLVLVLLIVLNWDFNTQWALLRHRFAALAIRVDVSEEQRMEAQDQHRRNEEELQESIWHLTSKVSALQSRVEALTARLNMVETPKARLDMIEAPKRESKGDDAKIHAAVDRFMSSFRA